MLDKVKQNIHDREIELFGIDISLNYLSIAKEKGINVALSKIEEIPYKESFFDVIVCTDVLEHVFDLNSALRNILKVLCDGGYLIVRVPNKEELSCYLDKCYPYQYVHLRTFDKSSLVLLMEKVFKLKTIEITNGLVKPYRNSLKYRIPPIKYYDFFFRQVFKVLQKIVNKQVYKILLNYLYEPIEINGVFQKCQKN